MKKSLCETLPFGRSLAILAKSYYGALSRRLDHHAIERYYSILMLIESLPAGCTQQYICDQLKIDKVSMVRKIQFLLQEGYIKKILNPDDRRAYRVELTARSRQILPDIHQAIDEVNNAALRGIPKNKIRELYSHLSAIQQNLDALPAEKIFINYKKSSVKK